MDVKHRAQSLIEFGLPHNWISLVVERFTHGSVTSLTSNELYMIVKRVCNILRAEPTVIDVRGECRVIGTLYGSKESLQSIFRIHGWPSDVPYVFLGDYLDIEEDQVQIDAFILLLIFKIVYPKQIILLRGARECEHCAADMGLLDLLTSSFTASLYHEFRSIFTYLPLAARANSVYLICNASISLDQGNMLDLEQVVRPCNICHRDGLCRLLARQPSRVSELEEPTGLALVRANQDVNDVNRFLQRSGMQICIRNLRVDEPPFDVGCVVEGVRDNVVSLMSSSVVRNQPCCGAVAVIHRNSACTLHPTDPRSRKPKIRLFLCESVPYSLS